MSAPQRPPRLGQHFLADPRLLRRIAATLDPTPSDVVLEIGPGKGGLTDVLAPAVGRVIAIERDRRLAYECGVRNAECGVTNVEIVLGDALKLDWHVLLGSHVAVPHSAFRTPHWKIVGNIPYNITSPLIAKALTPPLPERIVFLVQREVAERVAARPGTKPYGALSVGVQALARVERLFTIGRGAFRPPPRVESAVLRLTPLALPLVAPEEVAPLRTFVTACFTRRRKQLANAVLVAVAGGVGSGGAGSSRARVVEGLRALGLDPAARPETLEPGMFVRLLRWSRQL
ncbi:MAG: 16S rRNA (adenine(1518)-N(6)/adenine(1519)-N(6))-dimethyltransferase RsmA [Gemmatimonadales bacterium]